jgi:hypothetical protein
MLCARPDPCAVLFAAGSAPVAFSRKALPAADLHAAAHTNITDAKASNRNDVRQSRMD